MMEPVATELRRRGVAVSMISLAELRGLTTPPRTPPIQRVIPLEVRRRSGHSSKGVELQDWQRGSLAKQVAWVALVPRIWWLLRGARVVVIPNDAVFPYVELLGLLRRLGLRCVLMQEGIRFPFPSGHQGPAYGTGGCDKVCVWGEGSREYFARTGTPDDRIVVTGAPRMDSLTPSEWIERGAELRASLGLAKPPIAFLSNPIEIQGYGDKSVRIQCFERFVQAALPVLAERDQALIVKTHAYEDPNDYVAIVRGTAASQRTHILGPMPIFTVLAAAAAGIVMASTVGLEALLFGVPIGVLEIPGHPFAFEYVQHGAAVPLSTGELGARLAQLLDQPENIERRDAFIERHLHDRGSASRNVATVIERLL